EASETKARSTRPRAGSRPRCRRRSCPDERGDRAAGGARTDCHKRAGSDQQRAVLRCRLMSQPDVEAERRERDDGKVSDEKSGGDDADVLALLISVEGSRWRPLAAEPPSSLFVDLAAELRAELRRNDDASRRALDAPSACQVG